MSNSIKSLVFVAIFFTFFFVFSGAVSAACNPPVSAPSLRAKPGMARGTAVLWWNQVTNGQLYHLVYGFPNMAPMFGALNVGWGMPQPMFTVGYLNPGTTYNFQIWASCNDSEATTGSNWVSVKAP